MTPRSLWSSIVPCLSAGVFVSLAGCVIEPEGNDSLFLDTGFETAPGDGDGDGETGDPGDGDGDGDGDTGDGDGDTGDGDGDTGDGDGDTGDGDGDGDTSDCIAPNPGWGAAAQVGQPAPHFEGINQDGEQVSICAYEGLPIAIDTSAVWCGPCQMMSQCLGGSDAACTNLFGDPQVIDFLAVPLRAEIAANTFAWVTVLLEDANGGPPTASDAQAWDQAFPVANVWVIPDVSQQYYGHLPIQAFPSIWLIDAQMKWQELDQMNVFNTIINVYL